MLNITGTFKNIGEAEKWIKTLETLFNRIIKVYLGKKYCPIKLVVGDLSYTDHSKIVVAITEEEALTLTKGELMRILTLKVYHEAGHCKYTDRAEYEAMAREMAQLWNDAAEAEGLKPYMPGLINLASGLANSLEDGRMENQMVRDCPGVQKHREWYRLREWLKYDSSEAGVGEFHEILNNILEISTIGTYCNGFEVAYPIGTKVRNVVDSCIVPITDYIKSSTVGKGASHAVAIARNLKDYVLELIANSPTSEEGEGPQVIKLPPELEDLLRSMLEAQKNFSDGSTEETDSDGPIISILTDDMDASEESKDSEGKKPDLVIDLRKNPPEPTPPLAEPEGNGEGQGEGEDSEPLDEEQEENSSNADNSKEQKSDSSKSQSESSDEGKESEDGQNKGSRASEDEEDSKSENKQGSSSEGSEEEESNIKDEQDKGSGTSEEIEESEEELSEDSDCSEDDSFEEDNDESIDESDIPKSCGEQEKDSEAESDDVNIKALQANAKAFEESLRRRLERAAEETSSEVAQRVNKVNKDLEAADKVEEGNTKLSREDIDYLHENGYLEGYYSDVPSRNITKDRGWSKVPIPAKLVARGRQIEQEIRNIIASQSEPDRDNLFDGDLDEAAIGRFVTFGQGDIFCQEGDPKEADMCVLVRQDNSGSMSGAKFQLACEAGALIEQAFKQLVPLKYTYFDDSNCDVIKDWNDVDSSRSYLWDFRAHYGADGGNDDALAIMSAALELTHRPESHKVLIVISDGAPCCSIEAVTAAVQWARKNGIFVISFFIGDKNYIESSWELYKQMYEKYFCGVTPDKLGQVLVRFLRTMIESG